MTWAIFLFIQVPGIILAWEFLIKPHVVLRFVDFFVIYMNKRDNTLGILVMQDRNKRHLFIPCSAEAREALDKVAGDLPRYWWGGRVTTDYEKYSKVYEDAHHGDHAQIMRNVF